MSDAEELNEEQEEITSSPDGDEEDSSPSEDGGLEEETYRVQTDNGGTLDLTAEDMQALYNNYNNDSQWKGQNAKKGEELNTMTKRLDEYKSQLDERKTKMVAKETEMNRPRGPDPAAAANSFNADMKYAIADYKDKYGKDFDVEAVRAYSNRINLNVPTDKLEFYYHAWVGSRIEDIKQEVRETMVREMKKKKGLPGTGGMQTYTPSEPDWKDMKEVKKWLKGKMK